jgi:dipeptidyl aminopeptidase/acylaminoacyl peptidase
MPFHARRALVALGLIFGALALPGAVSQQPAPGASPSTSGGKHAITEKDLFDFTWIADPQLSPDGSRVAFTRVVVDDRRIGYETSIWMVATAGGAPPVRMTSGKQDSHPRWSPEGRRIAFVRSGGKGEDGKPLPPQVAILSLAGDEAVLDFSVTPDARAVVALVSTPVMIGDLFAVAADGAERRLTDVNQKRWSELTLTAPEELNYTSFDGTRIQAWVQKPPDFDPRRKYPLILNIHGGPHAAYGWVFDHEFQWMATRGYVVLYPNPRGSIGYGQGFGNIIQYHYPGDDYRDLMIGVDELLKRGYVDEKKLGVTGGSGGGVLTNWTIAHTGRFAGAVSQRDISNWACWWYTADFTLFQPEWFKAPPFQDPEDYARRSAITFVEDIHTPTMFVLGEADSRTPPECGGEELFRALKFLKRPTAMVMFPRETHELSRSGEPWHRIERLQHIVGWFDRWLIKVPHPEYDVTPDTQAAGR